MTFDAFLISTKEARPPDGLSQGLRALWQDAKGSWEAAHETAQAGEGGEADWVHAYLHRKEGDTGNAAYWYRRAGKPFSKESLDEEWRAITAALLPK